MTSLFLADKSSPGHDFTGKYWPLIGQYSPEYLPMIGQNFTAAAGLTSIKHKAAVPREAIIMPQVNTDL